MSHSHMTTDHKHKSLKEMKSEGVYFEGIYFKEGENIRRAKFVSDTAREWKAQSWRVKKSSDKLQPLFVLFIWVIHDNI